MGARFTRAVTVLVLALASAGTAAAGPRSIGPADPRADGTAAPGAGDRPVVVGADLEPLAIRGPALGGNDELVLREVAGAGLAVRVTPVDERGNPVDGGRVVVLRANERRAVRLTATLP